VSDPKNKSLVARIAGNIAAGGMEDNLLLRDDLTDARASTIARNAVALAEAIVARVERKS
jgi:hypothetical protein